jgi:hypothetical protein
MAYENSGNSGLFLDVFSTLFFLVVCCFLSFLIVSFFLFLMSCMLFAVSLILVSFLCHYQISKCIEMHRTLEQQSSGRRSRIVHF